MRMPPFDKSGQPWDGDVATICDKKKGRRIPSGGEVAKRPIPYISKAAATTDVTVMDTS